MGGQDHGSHWGTWVKVSYETIICLEKWLDFGNSMCNLLEFIQINSIFLDSLHTLKEAVNHEFPPLPVILTWLIVSLGYYSWQHQMTHRNHIIPLGLVCILFS